MNFRAIHQALPTLAYGDAIGNQVLHVQALLRARGFTSEVFAQHWDARFEGQCHHFSRYTQHSHPDNLLLLHYSIGGEVNAWAKRQPDHLALIYHNITPAHFFEGVNDDLAQLLTDARNKLGEFAATPAIADSPYNQLELESLGFRVLGVVPPVVNIDRLLNLLSSADAQKARAQFGKQGTLDWLFVGRLAPSKCIHDILNAFYIFHTFIQTHSRLLLVGGSNGMEPYEDWLHRRVTTLSLEGAVVFAGHQPDGALAAFYEMADVYVSMSEHEGFCVPVLEAMQFGVPVLAYNSTNVPHTLGNAGVLLNRKDPKLASELAFELCSDAPLRTRMIATQRARLSAFGTESVQQNFWDCLRLLEERPR